MNIKNWLLIVNERFLSTPRQIQRVILLAAILLVLVVLGFGGYYYYDRYYTAQTPKMQVNLSQAEQAVRDDPQSQDKRLMLAETYMGNRRFDDAIAQAAQVTLANPDNQRAWMVTGVANALKGNPSAAVGPLQKYLDANKDSDMPGLNKTLQSVAYYLGDSYLQLNQPDKAVPPLEKAVEWGQTDADAMYKLGLAYSGVQEYEKAVSMFQGAITFVPNYTEAYDAMARAYTALKQPQLVAYARGMEAYSKKDYGTALTLLLKSAEADPGFGPTFDGLGLTYEAMSNLPSAKSSYEVALKLDSTDFSASTGLQRVEALLKK
jgi:tetratricopeptide (TPR) repeat protein